MSPESGDGIRSDESGDQSDRIPAIWPESWILAGSGQIRPACRDPASPAKWPESGRLCRIPVKLSGFRPLSRILAILAGIR
jgi:hypothetical protein